MDFWTFGAFLGSFVDELGGSVILIVVEFEPADLGAKFNNCCILPRNPNVRRCWAKNFPLAFSVRQCRYLWHRTRYRTRLSIICKNPFLFVELVEKV